MDHLREGIGLRGYGQKDPLLEYKKEGYLLFQNMIRQFREDVLEKVFHVQISDERQVAQIQRAATPRAAPRSSMGPVTMQRGVSPQMGQKVGQAASNVGAAAAVSSPVSVPPSAGRNDPCPCGSGKKFKKCHGA